MPLKGEIFGGTGLRTIIGGMHMSKKRFMVKMFTCMALGLACGVSIGNSVVSPNGADILVAILTGVALPLEAFSSK